MNQIEKESGLEFEFLVKYYNFDSKDSIYENNKFCGNNAVDFLMLDSKHIYFNLINSCQSRFSRSQRSASMRLSLSLCSDDTGLKIRFFEKITEKNYPQLVRKRYRSSESRCHE
jgi:hypothetical protein